MNKLKRYWLPILLVTISVLTFFATVIFINALSTVKYPTEVKKGEVEIWGIYKIEPVESKFNVTVKNTLGKIRNYNNVDAYGVSFNHKSLALYQEEQFVIVDLGTDTSTKFEVELGNIRVNPGESISWSRKDDYLAATLIDVEKGESYLMTRNIESATTKLTQIDIPYNATIIENAYFSPVENSILVRTYQKDDIQYPNEDGSLPTLYEIPAFLTLLNYENEVINSEMINDFAKSQYIIYSFDTKGRARYFIDNKPIVNVISDIQYSKIKISK